MSPSAPPAKKSNVLTIVLAIVGGIVVLGGIGVGLAIYLVMSSPDGRAIVGMMGEAVKISAKAQKAPGTKDLRAMGCQQAMVMGADDFAKLMSHVDAGRASSDPVFGEIVTCSAKLFGTPPTCEDVASKYVSTVGPRAKPFMVTVQGAKNCSLLFDASGGRIKRLDGFEPPPAPPAVPED